MKLDKIKFAGLISYISTVTGKELSKGIIVNIDDYIDVEAPRYDVFVDMEKVNELLSYLTTSTEAGLIPAIKAYRALTNASLLEAKAAVEKYRK